MIGLMAGPYYFLLFLLHIVVGQENDPTEFPASCFEETTAFGRPGVSDPQEFEVTDKTYLDNIKREKLGNSSRVALIRYCTSPSNGYLESVQAGSNNGIGSEMQWFNVVGDDQTRYANNVCGTFQLEDDDYRVASIEVGFLDSGPISGQGVIWLRFLTRELKNLGRPSTSDVTVTIGKVETVMMSRTLKFTQKEAFLGFHGKVSASTKKPVTQLGAISFKCRDVVTFVDTGEKTWKDETIEFYEENDIFIFAGCGLLTIMMLTCCICCCCVKCKKREIRRLTELAKKNKKEVQQKYIEKDEPSAIPVRAEELNQSSIRLRNDIIQQVTRNLSNTYTYNPKIRLEGQVKRDYPDSIGSMEISGGTGMSAEHLNDQTHANTFQSNAGRLSQQNGKRGKPGGRRERQTKAKKLSGILKDDYASSINGRDSGLVSFDNDTNENGQNQF